MYEYKNVASHHTCYIISGHMLYHTLLCDLLVYYTNTLSNM